MPALDVLTSLDQLPESTAVAIYGAGGRGIEISEIIRAKRRDIDLVAFIDDFKTGAINDIRICTIGDLSADRRRELVVIIGTMHAGDVADKIQGVAKVYLTDIKATLSSTDYFSERELEEIGAHVEAVTAALGDADSRTLYSEIIRARGGQANRLIEIYRTRLGTSRQYLDYTNKAAIGRVIDGGVFDGFTSLQFLRLFPALMRIYGFDIFPEFLRRSPHGAALVESGVFELVHSALLDDEGRVSVEKDHGHGSASKVAAIAGSGGTEVPATTIDAFRSTLSNKIDFIKLDLEGADAAALRGAMGTILQDRPQLAISIYHSKHDVVEIPTYLVSRLPAYHYYIGHYSSGLTETVLYAIPSEIDVAS